MMSNLVATIVIEIGLVCTIVLRYLRGFQILFGLFRDAKIVSDSCGDLLDRARFFGWGLPFRFRFLPDCDVFKNVVIILF